MFIAFQHSCIPLYRLNMVEVWPHAQGKLCCLTRHHFKTTPTSLRPLHHSCRFHPTWTVLTTVGTLWRRWDLRSHIIIFHRMPLAILRVPCRCISPLLPCRHWPSPNVERIGVYSVIDGFIPPPDSPSYTCPGIAYEAAPFAFKLRPAVLAGTPG